MSDTHNKFELTRKVCDSIPAGSDWSTKETALRLQSHWPNLKTLYRFLINNADTVFKDYTTRGAPTPGAFGKPKRAIRWHQKLGVCPTCNGTGYEK